MELKRPHDIDPRQMRETIEAGRDIAGLGAWSWDERNQTKFWGARTLEIFGLAPDADVTRELFLSLLHPDDIARYEAAWAAGTDPDGDHIYRLVYRIRRASDGAERWISSQGRFDFEDGRMTRVAGVLRDITEEQIGAEKLRRTERRLELALGNSHIAVSEQDLDLRYTWIFNPKLGYAAEGVIGKTDFDLMQAECAAELDKIKRSVIASGKPARAEVKAAAPGQNIEWYEAYVEPLRDASGAVIGVSTAAAEISEQKRTQALLREGEERLRLALDAADAGIWEFTPATGELVLSDGTRELLGFARSAIVTPEAGRNAFHADDRARLAEGLRKTLKSGERVALELRVQTPDGATHWVEARAEARLDQEPRRIFGVVQDVTARKTAADKIEALLHEVNHRAKNLLSLVQGIARQTLRRHPDDFMETFGARIHALAASQDVQFRHQWREVEIGALVRSQIQPFEDSFGARFVIEGAPLRLSAPAAQAIGMALHELATNAVRHGALSSASGNVAVAWGRSIDANDDAKFSMTWKESGGPPVSTPERTGFGTAVMREALQSSLGATIRLDHAAAGLAWRLECPLAAVLEETRPGTPPVDSDRPAPRSAGRILLVEDEPLVALELTQSLRDAGFAVAGPARSVAQALELIEQGGCDAGVLDINLGEETSEPIARELMRRGAPFVTLSGYAAEHRPAVFEGVKAFSKPVRTEDLIAEMRQKLEGGAADR
ncbi:MAG: PAS domain-containing protein [Beijerinckiaceae bacterium]